MLRYFLIFVVLIAASVQLTNAQTVELKGQVVVETPDGKKIPLKGATVDITPIGGFLGKRVVDGEMEDAKGRKSSTKTDKDGKFKLQVPILSTEFRDYLIEVYDNFYKSESISKDSNLKTIVARKRDFDEEIDDGIKLLKEGDAAYKSFRSMYYESALNKFGIAIGLKPEDSSGYFFKGTAYARKEQYDSAIASFNRAIELAPKSPYPFAARADAFRDKGDFVAALRDFTKAIELDPKKDYFYSDRAFIYQKMNKKDAAIADYREALTLDPENEDAKEGLAKLGVKP